LERQEEGGPVVLDRLPFLLQLAKINLTRIALLWYKYTIENGFQYQIMQKKAIEQLTSFLAGQGLRATSQRDVILKVFAKVGQHVSAEELYARVKKDNPRIGYATVYRTLKLLAEAGFAEARRFHDGFTRFEYKNTDDHHDHLICTRCGAIFEFENERIETLQKDVARRRGFKVHSHRLELYGLCVGCQKKTKSKKKSDSGMEKR
jgi:Fur family ferric uptake transcriptional regulator